MFADSSSKNKQKMLMKFRSVWDRCPLSIMKNMGNYMSNSDGAVGELTIRWLLPHNFVSDGSTAHSTSCKMSRPIGDFHGWPPYILLMSKTIRALHPHLPRVFRPVTFQWVAESGLGNQRSWGFSYWSHEASSRLVHLVPLWAAKPWVIIRPYIISIYIEHLLLENSLQSWCF